MHASEKTPSKPPQPRVAGESCKLVSPNLDRWLAAGHPRVTQPGRATRTPTGQLAFNLKHSSETACHPEHPQLGKHKAPGPHISGPLARQGLPRPSRWFELGVSRPDSYLVTWYVSLKLSRGTVVDLHNRPCQLQHLAHGPQSLQTARAPASKQQQDSSRTSVSACSARRQHLVPDRGRVQRSSEKLR